MTFNVNDKLNLFLEKTGLDYKIYIQSRGSGEPVSLT
jgi:hypothetical protein